MKLRKPIIGIAFESEFQNLEGNINSYIAELEYYGRGRFRQLIKDGRQILVDLEDESNEDAGQFASEWQDDCDTALTEYAQHAAGHDFIYFGAESGSVGFFINVDSAIEDCDLRVDDTSEIPRGFSGIAVHVNDHGNVTAYRYSRGRGRELFAVV